MTDEQIRDTIEKALKEKGLIKQSNTVSYPPKPINTDDLVFDSEHANKKHDVTEEQAKEYIRAAIISIARKFPGQPQEFENYFSENGAAFVDIVTKHITTAFPSEDFNQTVQDIVSEAMKHVK